MDTLVGGWDRARLIHLFNVIICLCLSVGALLGCKPEVRTRPIGYLRVGPLADYLNPETKIPSMWLVVRRDVDGLSAMSTLCSYDLNEVKGVADPSNGQVFECDLCHSKFKLNGEVIIGPARAALPYYSLKADKLEIEGPKDTLYVRVGDEVKPDWRLRLHFVEE